MRISDWSSDVCSSDLARRRGRCPGGGIIAALDARDVEQIIEIDSRPRRRILHRVEHGGGDAAGALGLVDCVHGFGSACSADQTQSSCPFPDVGGNYLVKIGRASVRTREVQYVWIWVVAVQYKKKNKTQNKYIDEL